MSTPISDLLIWRLFQQLRRHQFFLGPDDFLALRRALQAGFGLQSAEALFELCSALWTKSPREREVLKTLFKQLELVPWTVPAIPTVQNMPLSPSLDSATVPLPQAEADLAPPTTYGYSEFLPLHVQPGLLTGHPFIFEPQFPLTYREIVQIWRRLRRPVRSGPAVELDVEATIARRCQTGVLASVVLRPRRRNSARLVLLVDRKKSMAPFHQFTDAVCSAIAQAARLDQIAIYYFQNVPVLGANDALLDGLGMYAVLDSILARIEPQDEGTLFEDAQLLRPTPLQTLLETATRGAHVVVLSDGGAAHGRYNPTRLLDTLAFFKALRQTAASYVWLNPLPKASWANSTAEQISRHIPMFPMTQMGMSNAVNVLRGHLFNLEKPL
jgi:uncharacterized protein